MRFLILPILMLTLITAPAIAAGQKSYHVTGALVEATNDKIVVQKSKKVKWEMARTPNTLLPADVKPGDKVNIEYSMTAGKVVVKEAAKPTAKAAALKTPAPTVVK